MRTEAVVVEASVKWLHPTKRNQNEMTNVSQNQTVANIGIHPPHLALISMPLPCPSMNLNPEINPDPQTNEQLQSQDQDGTQPTNKLQAQDESTEPIPFNANFNPLFAPGVDGLVDVAVAGDADADGDAEAVPNQTGDAVHDLLTRSRSIVCPVSTPVRFAVDLELPLPDVVEDFSRLNRSDLAELECHKNLIGRVERDYLGKVKRKSEIFPERFQDADYLSNSAIMLLSTGWSSAHKYAHCSIRGQVNRGGACKVHKYCPYCSWYAGEKAQLTYVPAFGDGNWHWLTGSFVGDLLYDGSAGAAVNWLHHWDAYQAGFNEWLENNTVRGIYWTEELAVNSFCPTRVLPHVHAVVDADELNEAALEQVQESVNAHLAKVVGFEHLQPDLDVEEIGTQRNLMNRIGYMFKPLKLVRPYRNAWAGACLHNRAGAQQLNNAATDLVLGFSQVSRMLPDPVLGYDKTKSGRNKMQARGTLDPKRGKNFIGKHKSQHKQYKRLLRELREEAAQEYIEVREVDEVEDEMTFAE